MAFSDDWDAVVDQFAESFGERVTLQRGTYATVGIVAQAWDHEYESTGPQGLLTTVAGRDWLVHYSEYRVDGEPVQPREGDQLTDAAGQVWEVLPIDGRPACEQHGHDWLLRTKQVPAA